MNTCAFIRVVVDDVDECYGLCEVTTYQASIYLQEADIPHHIYYEGTVRNTITGRDKFPHMWIELDTEEGPVIIDYRVRCWVGEEGNTPHGVFLKQDYPHMHYKGQRVDNPQEVFTEILYLKDYDR